MRKRAMIALVVTTTLVVAGGGMALAKGPESATVTGPGIAEPIELINADYFDSDYTDHVKELMRQTGLWYAAGGGSRIPAQPEGDLGPVYTLTWASSGPPGDPVDKRTIRQLLYLHAENGPLIHTPSQIGLEGWGPGVVGWAIAPSGLMDTLAALGIPVSAENDPLLTTESSHDAAASNNEEAAASVENKPTDGVGYMAIMGFGFVVVVTWAVLRRTSDHEL